MFATAYGVDACLQDVSIIILRMQVHHGGNLHGNGARREPQEQVAMIARVSHRAQPAITTADAHDSAYVSCSCSLQGFTNSRLADNAGMPKA